MRYIVAFLLGGCLLLSCSDKKDRAAEASKAAIESLNASEEKQNSVEAEQQPAAVDQQVDASPQETEEVAAAVEESETVEPEPLVEDFADNSASVDEPQSTPVQNSAASGDNVSSSDMSSLSEKFGFPVSSGDDVELLNEVASWLGSPYMLAGNDKSGVDCSGFICSVYQTIYNKKLPRRTCEIYEKCKTIPVSEAKMGDIVFFRPDGKMDETPNYAGIYLKNNKFVIVSSSKGVTIADLGSNYYKKTFVSAAKVVAE
jgi:cell wall-associated NlpC family hydrolase